MRASPSRWSSWARNGTWLANAVYSNGYVASAGGLGNFTIPYIEVSSVLRGGCMWAPCAITESGESRCGA